MFDKEIFNRVQVSLVYLYSILLHCIVKMTQFYQEFLTFNKIDSL